MLIYIDPQNHCVQIKREGSEVSVVTKSAQNSVKASNLGLFTIFFLLVTACGSSAHRTPLIPTSNPVDSLNVHPEIVEKTSSIQEPTSNFASSAATQNGDALRSKYPQDNIKFIRICVEQGLSQCTVFTILHDSRGFMWFGTEDGLNKYDGYSFTVYTHDPDDPGSLNDDWISVIYEDHAGVVWIGTRDGGLERYDRELDRFTHFDNDPSNPHSLSDNEVLSIYEDRAAVLWIGTRGGLDRLDRENETFTHYQHDPADPNSLAANAVSSIYEDREGLLWIGTDGGGLDVFDQENERFAHYQHDPNNPNSLISNSVTSISQDLTGAIWIGTSGGLERFNQESETFTHYLHDLDDHNSLSDNRVTSIYQDRSGELWIGTQGGGLNRLDRETDRFIRYQSNLGVPYSLSKNWVVSILEDNEGTLWVGAVAGGVNKLDVLRSNFIHHQNDPNNPQSLSSNYIRSFYQDPSGVLWVATDSGLDLFDRATGVWHHEQYDPNDPGSLSDDFVTSIYQDRSGVIWIGTYFGGLNRYDRSTGRFIRYQHDPNDPHSMSSNDVRSIYEDQYGALWIATRGGGLNQLDRETGHFIRYQNDPDDPQSISSDNLWDILEDQSGVLWIGTEDGLNRFDRATESFIRYQNDPNDPGSLSHNSITSIHQDQSGVIWIGTHSGLNKFDPISESFVHYLEVSGLANDVITGILEDEFGNLWLSTNKGLSRFDPRTETFRNYDATDGLQSNEFNGGAYYKSSSGEMFFGGINGFNVFYPNRIMKNAYVPPVVLTSLTQDGEEVDLSIAVGETKEVTFKWPNNSFEFDFAVLSYARPERNQYAYLLEGFDEDWNEIGTKRHGKYTNLPGGIYTLRLKGSNNDGVWNEIGASIKVTILPPIWGTWWFRGIIFCMLVGGAVGGYRLRLRNIEAQSRKLEKQVVSRTRELEAINAIASVVSRSLDLERVLTNALDKTLEVMEMEAGGIYLLRQDAQVLTIAAHKGLGMQFMAEINNLKVGEGFSGRVAQTGEPLIVQDLSTDPRLTRSAVKDSGFQSLAIAPLVSRAKVLGTLYVVTRRDREFSQQDIELLISVGGQIGVAVENAQLYEQAKQMAVVEERQRLAHELHDSVTQSLHSSTLLAEAGQRLASRGDLERAKGYLTRLGEISQQALKEMRLLVYELRPLHLRNVGLVEALEHRLDAVERRAGVEVNLLVDGEVELPPDVEASLFRIAQEALNNALKHATPTSIMVTVRIEGESHYKRVELSVMDDGRGFDPAALSDEGGLGLVSMRQRVDNIGGVLDIRSTPGEGTHVRASVDMGASTDSPETIEVDG